MKNEAIENIFKIVKEHKIKMVDLKFMDFPGQWQHFSVPVHELTESSFEEGFGFDGSSIRGWKSINESDMLVIPDPTTAFIDPFIEVPTLSLICDVYDPLQKKNTSDARAI
jgi:glutamine synthetase